MGPRTGRARWGGALPHHPQSAADGLGVLGDWGPKPYGPKPYNFIGFGGFRDLIWLNIDHFGGLGGHWGL